MKNIILASNSGIRKQILESAGVKFKVQNSNIDEEALKKALIEHNPKISLSEMALKLAEKKALAVSEENPETLVVAADQILALKELRFDKPKTISDARAQLLSLKGQTHHLITALTCAQAGRIEMSLVNTPELKMRDFSAEFLDWYLNNAGQAVTKSVGAYQLEGLGINLFESIEGDYFSILGLPLLPLLAFLRSRGFLP